jgi:diguanylate cyclase (GGDEF)-like protein/putative nucleotidyltransferase with HDIG domain
MSAIQSDVAFRNQVRESGREPGRSLFASAYFWLLLAIAIFVTLPFLARLSPSTPGWTTFALLALGVAGAQLFVTVTPGNQSYHTTAVFLLPAALLLPPELVALMAFVQHVPDWLKRRLPFHIQAFNIANYTLATMAAWAAARGILDSRLVASKGAGALLAGAAACVLFVGLNHLLLAPMLRLARGLSLRASGLFAFENLPTDLVLAALGVGVASIWRYDPWLTMFAIAPLVPVHRSLSVPALQAEARIDPKTGLYNARYFASTLREELERAMRFTRPLSLIMADLDLLRDINNTYGHLAGDAVLAGIAKIFREQLREYDVPARFGGEEFSILLPETELPDALAIADRIRRAVARAAFEVETSSEPIHATVSLGVAQFPRDGVDANELVHQADLAVYRAKLQGRNRVLDASDEAAAHTAGTSRAATGHAPAGDGGAGSRAAARPGGQALDGTAGRPEAARNRGPELLLRAPPARDHRRPCRRRRDRHGRGGDPDRAEAGPDQPRRDRPLVGIGQALSLQVEETGSISVSAVGALAGAAIVGPRAALALAVTMAAIEWSARRSLFHQVLFNVGTLTLASLAAAEIFSVHVPENVERPGFIGLGLLAGLVYFGINTGLLSLAVAVEGHLDPWRAWRERFIWLLTHYLMYGLIAGVIFEAYQAIGVWALVVFVLPLLLMRKTQEAYLRHTERSAKKLREAAETIQSQNISLEQVNRELKERSTAAMESLSATVDARDEYTAGHSRRVQDIALAIGRELELSAKELDLLGYAALFHDIGKLAIPDAVLLKPASLTDEEWTVMTKHADESASIINRLGFLNDAVPAIRHHHERYDGTGYPDRLAGEDIPLGARIIHVADAFDAMLSTRIYRPALPLGTALSELRDQAGFQFCPRCVAALDAVMSRGELDLGVLPEPVAAAQA